MKWIGVDLKRAGGQRQIISSRRAAAGECQQKDCRFHRAMSSRGIGVHYFFGAQACHFSLPSSSPQPKGGPQLNATASPFLSFTFRPSGSLKRGHIVDKGHALEPVGLVPHSHECGQVKFVLL
jgi:hypothetical protein